MSLAGLKIKLGVNKNPLMTEVNSKKQHLSEDEEVKEKKEIRNSINYPSKKKFDMESDLDNLNDMDQYFRQIENMDVIDQRVSDINMNNDEDDEDFQISIFTAKPNKERQRKIFSFIPKDVLFARKNRRNVSSSNMNPFEIAGGFPQMDSGATPLFKIGKPERPRSEGKSTNCFQLLIFEI